MMQVRPEEVDAALDNVKDWLRRGQDGKYRIEETPDGEDTLIHLNGCYSLRMIVLHALEGARAMNGNRT